MKSLLLLSLFASTLTLVACGGTSPVNQSNASAIDSPVSSNTPTLQPDEKINGIVVPPDPGSAKDLTVAGVNLDGNGIRDEIDRWIATKYWDKPGALDAIRVNHPIHQCRGFEVQKTEKPGLPGSVVRVLSCPSLR